MPSAYETYKMYVDLKLHFDDDVFIYGQSSSNASERSFERRRDGLQFSQLSARYSLKAMKDFMIANFVEKSGLHVYDLIKPRADRVYLEWRKRVESLTYRFTTDCDYMLSLLESSALRFNDLFITMNEKEPMIIGLAASKHIDLETVVVLQMALHFLDRLKRPMRTDHWPTTYRRILKYALILECGNASRFKQILKRKLDVEYPSLIGSPEVKPTQLPGPGDLTRLDMSDRVSSGVSE